jgi:acetate kinase
MNILTFNCGSSSLKFRIIAMPDEKELVSGEAQQVGPKTSRPSRVVIRENGKEEIAEVPMPTLTAAFSETMRLLEGRSHLRPQAIAHRIVHGADEFHSHVMLDAGVLAKLRAIQGMAPLHNPPATDVAEACMKKFPKLPNAIIIDMAFHATIPEYAATYALPRDLCKELGIRKYGFHGISHQYSSEEAARLLQKPAGRLNAVCCHLGSGGASLCAIEKGRSIDNTMGYSPLQGLVMSTRSGDLDPALTLRLLAEANGDAARVSGVLNKKSGVLGMSGFSADIRDVLSRTADTKEVFGPHEISSQLYLWRIRKYLGAYLTVVREPDAIIFTDTIGEQVPQVRHAVCAGMDAFGVEIDAKKNSRIAEFPADVATDKSAVRIFVIQANEELAMARFAWRMLSPGNN